MKVARGSLVSPSEPRSQAGLYWGYTVRLAGSLSEVFTGCPHSSGYDLMLGTSEKGQDAAAANLPKFQHLLVVFGGVAGLEAALAADSSLTAEDPAELFDQVHTNIDLRLDRKHLFYEHRSDYAAVLERVPGPGESHHPDRGGRADRALRPARQDQSGKPINFPHCFRIRAAGWPVSTARPGCRASVRYTHSGSSTRMWRRWWRGQSTESGSMGLTMVLRVG